MGDSRFAYESLVNVGKGRAQDFPRLHETFLDFSRLPSTSLTILPVVLLPVNVAAGLIQFALDVRAFAWGKHATGTAGAGFGGPNACLFGFEPSSFDAR